MQRHHLANEGKPDAGASDAPAFGAVHLMEAVEDVRLFAFGNADTGVADCHEETLTLDTGADLYPRGQAWTLR